VGRQGTKERKEGLRANEAKKRRGGGSRKAKPGVGVGQKKETGVGADRIVEQKGRHAGSKSWSTPAKDELGCQQERSEDLNDSHAIKEKRGSIGGGEKTGGIPSFLREEENGREHSRRWDCVFARNSKGFQEGVQGG